jgi:hypothetical protein
MSMQSPPEQVVCYDIMMRSTVSKACEGSCFKLFNAQRRTNSRPSMLGSSKRSRSSAASLRKLLALTIFAGMRNPIARIHKNRMSVVQQENIYEEICKIIVCELIVGKVKADVRFVGRRRKFRSLVARQHVYMGRWHENAKGY